MKKTDNTDNYRHSFLFHFLIRFIFMIILPILISWWLYVEVLRSEERRVGKECM